MNKSKNIRKVLCLFIVIVCCLVYNFFLALSFCTSKWFHSSYYIIYPHRKVCIQCLFGFNSFWISRLLFSLNLLAMRMGFVHIFLTISSYNEANVSVLASTWIALPSTFNPFHVHQFFFFAQRSSLFLSHSFHQTSNIQKDVWNIPMNHFRHGLVRSTLFVWSAKRTKHELWTSITTFIFIHVFKMYCGQVKHWRDKQTTVKYEKYWNQTWIFWSNDSYRQTLYIFISIFFGSDAKAHQIAITLSTLIFCESIKRMMPLK